MRARPGLADCVDWRLYYVTDTALSGGPEHVPYYVEQAVLGGAGVVQIRDKSLDHDDFMRLTRACLEANDRAAMSIGRKAAIVVNDRLDVAADLGLHFHQGQDDGDVRRARRLLGQDLLIGLSISNDKELAAELADPTADALGLSPIWSTPTKTDTAEALGLEAAARLVTTTGRQAKTLAIGGINLVNARWVLETGVDGLCVVSAITGAPDPRDAAAQLLNLWRQR